MPSQSTRSTRRVIVLGSTGSIGVNTLDVIEHLNTLDAQRFEVIGLAAGSNAELLSQQANRFNTSHVAVADTKCSGKLSGVDHGYTGNDAAVELIHAIAQPGDLVVGAIVGASGLPAILAAIDRGCDIALANKETLVAAGALVLPRVREKSVNLIPIDSEHSAIFQCLQAGRSIREVKRVVITGSGGPFRTWNVAQIEEATVEEALNHPTWNMGPKVTIDSASLMNKALEVIEAHWLFDLPSEKIEVIIHPQSLIHGFVEFEDGSVVSQMCPPDMRTPIQYALTWPQRSPGNSPKISWEELGRLDFEPVDHERFPAVKLAYRVIETGGTAGAVFNAANEAAVAAYLDYRIPFGRIMPLVSEALESITSRPVHTIEDVLEADTATRSFVTKRIQSTPDKVERRPLAGTSIEH